MIVLLAEPGKDVTFVMEADDDINDQIDAGYRTKYCRYGGRYVNPMVAPQARLTTIKLVPHSTRSSSGEQSDDQRAFGVLSGRDKRS